MSLYWIIYFLALLVSFTLTPVCRALALRRNLVDQPNARKIHQEPVPYLGGLSIFIAFIIASIGGLLHLPTPELTDKIPILGLFISTGIIFLLGIVDDARGLNAPVKFSVQIIASIILWYCGGRIELLTNPLGTEIKLGIFSLPFTIFWLVGITNAINLIDGMDGLAGGVTFIASFTLLLISLVQKEPVISILMAAVAGSTLGFLRYNFPPASIFMGNAGALTLGFILSSTAVITRYKATVAVTLLIPILALGIPILDTLLAILRRAWRGKPLFQADREHLHHRLMRVGLSQRQVVLFVYAICICLSITALSFVMLPKQYNFLILLGLGIVLLIGMLILRSLERQLENKLK
jgi:UDP-GlcNAc:undecaprenyl-phosphate/decaprenyl-phosphate GlcNAc-1-phosphate transferase